MFGVVPRLQATVLANPMIASNEWVSGFLKHPAGPFTIHFWAPTAKWLITIANIADLSRPADKLSMNQQGAVTLTGIVWSRYATQITPVNYNLLAVNAFMASIGMYQLYRIYDFQSKQPPKATVTVQ